MRSRRATVNAALSSGAKSSERGALIPAVAAIAFGLIAIAIILGLDTTRVKRASASLRRHAEVICREASSVAFLPDEAVRRFRDGVERWAEKPGMMITKALLVAPVGSSAGVDNVLYHYSNRETCHPDYEPYNPLTQTSGGSQPIRFGGLGADLKCSAGAHADSFAPGVDCELITDVCAAGPAGRAPLSGYPTSLWSDVYSAGNTIACELEGELKPLVPFLSARTVSAKVAWWIPLKVTPPYLEAESGGAPEPAAFSGLSIGVGTETTTWAGKIVSGLPGEVLDARFQSLDPAAGQSLNLDVAAFDPRRMNGARRFNFPSTSANRVLPSDGAFKVPDIERLANGPLSPASEEMLAACFNPLIFTRNLILSALVELAARHGQARNLTEIAHVNPKHLVAGAPPNRPVVMVPFGKDLLSESYQAPFVTYDSGDSLLFGKGGFILPWANYGGTTNAELVKHHTLIAEQVRACYHLYTNGAVLRPKMPLHFGMERLSPPIFRFQSASLHAAGQARSWDFGAPWGGASAPGRLLTAPELMYSLGAAQSCPVNKTAAVSTPWAANGCDKMSFPPSLDLAPDLIGYLDYQISGGDLAYPSPGLSAPVDGSGSVISPASGAQPNIARPMQQVTASNTELPRSVVLLFVHRVPSDTNEIDVLKERVDVLNNQQGRPVVIIFMPGTADESKLVGAYCDILRLGENCNDTVGNVNSLFFISPFNSVYGNFYTEEVDESGISTFRAEYEIFQRYWADLADNEPESLNDPYFYDLARLIFTKVLLRHEPKF